MDRKGQKYMDNVKGTVMNVRADSRILVKWVPRCGKGIMQLFQCDYYQYYFQHLKLLSPDSRVFRLESLARQAGSCRFP